MSIGVLIIFLYKSFINPKEYDYKKNISIQNENRKMQNAKNGLITINEKKYIKFNNQYNDYKIYENGEVKPIAEMLAYGCNDKFCIAKNDLDYVKKFKYKRGEIDTKRPEEIILSGEGDCDERSFLLGSLLLEQGIETILIYTKNHAFLGIASSNGRKEKNNSHIQIGNEKYYIAETTDINAEIGRSNGIRSHQVETIFNINKKMIVPIENAKINI